MAGKLHVVKPEPPAWADLTKEEQARQALAALGVSAAELNKYDAVHTALVELWRELKRQPTMREIHERAGLTGSVLSLRDILYRLREQGRVVSPRRGVNVPVID